MFSFSFYMYEWPYICIWPQWFSSVFVAITLLLVHSVAKVSWVLITWWTGDSLYQVYMVLLVAKHWISVDSQCRVLGTGRYRWVLMTWCQWGVPYYWVHPGRGREDGLCIGRSKLTRGGSFLGSVKVGASVHKHIFLLTFDSFWPNFWWAVSCHPLI